MDNNLAYKKDNLIDDIKQQDNKVEELILDCNKNAMDNLRNENFQQARELLRKAEKLLVNAYQDNPKETICKLMGITLNNLGCYYKRIAKPKVALKYLKKALQVEIFTLNEKSSAAGTHLNICAILSSLNDHEQALKHAKLAMEIIETARNNMLSNVKNSSELDDIQSDQYQSLTTTLIIACYNIGTEYEFLRQYKEGIQSFTKGYQISLKNLGNDHKMTQNLYDSMISLINKNQKIEEDQDKKYQTFIKRLEQNKGIRYHSEKRNNFNIGNENELKIKLVDSDYNGHRKTAYKSPRKVRTNTDFSDLHNRNTPAKLPKIENKSDIMDISDNNNSMLLLNYDGLEKIDDNNNNLNGSIIENLPKLISRDKSLKYNYSSNDNNDVNNYRHKSDGNVYSDVFNNGQIPHGNDNQNNKVINSKNHGGGNSSNSNGGINYNYSRVYSNKSSNRGTLPRKSSIKRKMNNNNNQIKDNTEYYKLINKDAYDKISKKLNGISLLSNNYTNNNSRIRSRSHKSTPNDHNQKYAKSKDNKKAPEQQHSFDRYNNDIKDISLSNNPLNEDSQKDINKELSNYNFQILKRNINHSSADFIDEIFQNNPVEVVE